MSSLSSSEKRTDRTGGLGKQGAEGRSDGVPVYAVFTNEQIAEMVTTKANSLAALRKIEGVGDSRIEKYGERFVAALQEGERTRPACSVPHLAERSSASKPPIPARS